jgi:nucleoside triphosphate diphosphatase
MYQLNDLLHLMSRLRDPQHGCPWDHASRTYASIVPHTLEEAYEVADAIERGDFDHLPGELGDSAVPGCVLQPTGPKEEGPLRVCRR